MAQDTPVKVEASRRQGQGSEQETYRPLVDAYETENELVLIAEVPGARKDGVSLNVDRGVLTLEAEADFETPGEGFTPTYASFAPGKYARSFALSDEIDRDRISASLSAGVLTVHLPKAESARTRKVQIQVNE
jgi:HSP20 family molecular chaperone IbpA